MVAPGVIIAATGSGTGKTTIATGLMAALSQRMSVAPFKVGPDYIDPSFHGIATGRPGRNLDEVMCPGLLGPLYAHGSAQCDIGIVEGVMGLFDGKISSEEAPTVLPLGSTARVAVELGMPVVLVVDVRGMSQSISALVRGFAQHHPDVPVNAVILNKVGSARHEKICRDAVEALGIPVLGAIPRSDNIAVPSRHLGLVTAGELEKVRAVISDMAALVARYVDLEAIVALAACNFDGAPWNPQDEVKPAFGNTRIAIVSGRAFSFVYPELLELISATGASWVTFDPLDEDFPPGIDGLIIPGGFPEEYLEQLALRTDLTSVIAQRVREGMKIYAECAGLLWLLNSLDGVPMLGLISGSARMTSRLTMGYRFATAASRSVLFQAGEHVVGHEFHHTAVVENLGGAPAWQWLNWQGSAVEEGTVVPNIYASYLHIHPAAYPGAIEKFVEESHG